MQNFKKLIVYQEAFNLSKLIYNELKEVKSHFRLKEQLFGATSAIAANLAEMSAFENKNQQKQKLITCIAEANETEFWLDFCKEVGLLNEEKHKNYSNVITKIRMMLLNLLKSIKSEINPRLKTLSYPRHSTPNCSLSNRLGNLF